MAWVRRESWRGTLALYCSLGFASAAACSGNVDSDREVPEDAAGGSAGTGASGGASGTGGSGASGRGGAGGSAGRGGATGSGGGGTSGNAGGIGGMDCQPAFGDPTCIKCGLANCCVELINCRSDASCSRGQEFFCIAGCVSGTVNDGGVADDATFAQCASNCAVAGTIISSATNDAIACVRYGERADGSVGADCFVECFAE